MNMMMGTHCPRCVLTSSVRHYRNVSSAALPRITVPHQVVNRLDRIKAKHASKKHQTKRVYKGPVVISCKRKEFNYFKGQTYSDFSPQFLASGGWKHRKSVGDYFTVNAYDGNPALISTSGESMDFSSLGISPELVRGLTENEITKPTNIQALTIPTMLKGKNVLCAAETGSGKTLAFLLPLLHRIQYYKHMMRNAERTSNSPYGVILTPARELADQIYAVARDLGPYVNCQSRVVCGGRGTQKILKNPLETESDLLITTPGVFSKLLTNKIFNQSRLLHIVLDEADTLLDDSFNELTLRLLRKMKITSEKLEEVGAEDQDVGGMQVAFVGATLPTSMQQILGDVVPMDTIEKITTTHLHRLMPHVPQKFMRVSPSSKPEELLSILKSNTSRNIPTLVFCNKSATANYLGMFLEENNISNVILHSNMPQKVRNGRFNRLQNAKTNVMIATDIASRGLDTIRVQHVINFEFPPFMSDYVHRVGRVGRVGSQGAGFVLSFVSQLWEVDLLWNIESAARQMTELHNVNSNIKRKLTGLIQTKYHNDSDEANV